MANTTLPEAAPTTTLPDALAFALGERSQRAVQVPNPLFQEIVDNLLKNHLYLSVHFNS
ncbi:hypothetical protein LC605_27980 [Nostoc sp. CHAB 5836]|uniref:hypothetical protein n=1 Tax=Nostoc sp. CHAB 5836 TaxID=2780404 RepID=UPI001E497D8F|nr:hypothetical protein [Nostoc sp. CHAB 5836]MCC5618856.1 hypothetical protein [Nostoc sp. CHAB 5836]